MVKLKEGESLDSLMRRFKKQVNEAGIILDYRKHLEYVGPSEKRRLKKEAARKRAIKLARKRAKFYTND